MTRNRTTRNPAPRPPAERVVYEVRRGDARPVTVEAGSAGDLAEQLARLAGLDPYGSRAAAHVLHVLRGRIDAPTFSARRLGSLVFQPDELTPAPAPRRAAAVPAITPAAQGPDATPDVPTDLIQGEERARDTEV